MSGGIMFYLLRKTFFVSIAMYIFPVLSFAQQQKIDSLKALLPYKEDSVRADILYALAYEHVDFDYRLGVLYASESLTLSKQLRDSLRLVKAGRIKAVAFRRLGEMDSAMQLCSEFLPIARRNHFEAEERQLLRGLAIAYTYKADYPRALHYNFELLKIAEQNNDTMETSAALNNIGLIYFKFYDYETALKYFNRAYRAMAASDDRISIGVVMVNMVLCYSILEDFQSAQDFLNRSLDFCAREKCSTSTMLEILSASGTFYLHQGKLDSAAFYYHKSFELAKKLGVKRSVLVTSNDLSRVWISRHQLSLAERYLDEARSLGEGSPFRKELSLVYYHLALLHKETGAIRKRVSYQARYIVLADSMYNRAQANALSKMESDYTERIRKASMADQERVLALKDQVIRWKKQQTVLWCLVVLLAIALLVILHRSYRARRSTSQFLEDNVRQRTTELERSYSVLQQVLDERNAAIARTSQYTKRSIATIYGLCSTALREKRDNRNDASLHLQKISDATPQLLMLLDSIQKVNATLKASGKI